MYGFPPFALNQCSRRTARSLRADEPGNDAMPASDDYATAPKKRPRPASKRLSRTDATKKVG